MSRAPLTDAEGEVRELTAEDFKHFRPFREFYDAEFGPGAADAFIDGMKRLRGQRGPQKAPVKQCLTLRIDADVVARFKATGRGWQTRMNDALRQAAPPAP